MDFNATLDITTQPDDEDTVDRIFTQLADHHVAIGHTPTGGMTIILTLPADNLRQATVTALALAQAAGLVAIGVHVLRTDEFDRRAGAVDLPGLLSVQEAANVLGVTRQAVLSRITHHTLPATKVGSQWAIPAVAVRRHPTAEDDKTTS